MLLDCARGIAASFQARIVAEGVNRVAGEQIAQGLTLARDKTVEQIVKTYPTIDRYDAENLTNLTIRGLFEMGEVPSFAKNVKFSIEFSK